jgi:tripartite-type tricarboxylate transporter receptor subunit TctC
MEIFRNSAGMDMNHVPYKGSAAVTADLLAGRISMTLDNLLFWLPQIKDGKVRALAVTGHARSSLLPDVPTFGEAGFPDVQVGPWFGLVGPAGMPHDVVERLNREAVKALQTPDVRQRLAGAQIIGGTPDAFAAYLATERVKWADAVRRSGAKPE